MTVGYASLNPALSAAETALLRAACIQGPDAVAAFATWQSIADLDHLPHRQAPLLPLVARNLYDQGIEQPRLARIMGIYRRNWYANQLAFHALRSAVDTLGAAGIPTMVVGDAALALSVYPDAGARSIGIPAVATPPHTLDAAIACLQSWGRQAEVNAALSSRPSRRAWASSLRFISPQGQTVELNWHVLADDPYAVVDADGWAHAVSLAQDGAPIDALDATINLLRCATPSLVHAPVALADVAMLLQAGGIDWRRLMKLTADTGLALTMRYVLQTVETALGLGAPRDVIATLSTQPTPGFMRRALTAAQVEPESRSRMQRVTLHYARFRHMAAAQGVAPSLAAWLAYCQVVLGAAGNQRSLAGQRKE